MARRIGDCLWARRGMLIAIVCLLTAGPLLFGEPAANTKSAPASLAELSTVLHAEIAPDAFDDDEVFGRTATTPVHRYVAFQCGGCHLSRGDFDAVLPGFDTLADVELAEFALATSQAMQMPVDPQRRAEFQWRLRRLVQTPAASPAER